LKSGYQSISSSSEKLVSVVKLNISAQGGRRTAEGEQHLARTQEASPEDTALPCPEPLGIDTYPASGDTASGLGTPA
jgi:hypothetical protein